MAKDIQIDKGTLNAFRKDYDVWTEEIKKRATSTTLWKHPPADPVEMNLGAEFTTRLGDGNFNAGAKLARAIEGVRSEIFARLQATHAATYAIYGGITNLLKDSDAVEHLNTLTGQDFASYIPQSTPTFEPQGGSSSNTEGS